MIGCGCRIVFREHPPSHSLGPQWSFAIARPLSPTLARRGQTNAHFLVWVHGSRTTVVAVRELERTSGRRFGPYPSAASDGGQKMRRSTAKTLPNLQVNSIPSQRQTHFRGAERERGWTLAQQKPSPAQTSSFLPRPQPHPITPAPCLVLASRWRAWVCWRPRSSRKHL